MVDVPSRVVAIVIVAVAFAAEASEWVGSLIDTVNRPTASTIFTHGWLALAVHAIAGSPTVTVTSCAGVTVVNVPAAFLVAANASLVGEAMTLGVALERRRREECRRTLRNRPSESRERGLTTGNGVRHGQRRRAVAIGIVTVRIRRIVVNANRHRRQCERSPRRQAA